MITLIVRNYVVQRIISPLVYSPRFLSNSALFVMPKRKVAADSLASAGSDVAAKIGGRAPDPPKLADENDQLPNVGGKSKMKKLKSLPADLTVAAAVESKENPEAKQSQKKSVTKKKSSKEFQLTDEMVRVREKVELAAKNSQKCLGFHVSAAGGLENAVYEATSSGCRSFAMFTRSQRTWKITELAEETVERFRAACKEYNFQPDMIVPHGSYLMNCGSPSPATLEKSRSVLQAEVKNCQRLGIKYYNFHPGSTCGELEVEESIALIAESINMAHKAASGVVILIENMSRQGNTIGGKFEELRDIIKLVEDKTRIGVCFDTCHAFAAGYDIKSAEGYKETISSFDQIVGLDYLKAIHFNDSMHELGAHKDRHANVGKGLLGLDGMTNFMRDPLWDGIPMVLETPECDYVAEMIQLYTAEGSMKKA